jgi:hypothetical protein
MAHFAKIEDGVVRSVIVVSNEAIENLEFPESEPKGQKLLATSGFTGVYLQCSFSGRFRGAYPGPGWFYHEAEDLFSTEAVVIEETL